MLKKFRDKQGKIITINENNSQFVGLLDKNGKEIFENDICKYKIWSNRREVELVGKVFFQFAEWRIQPINDKRYNSVGLSEYWEYNSKKGEMSSVEILEEFKR